MENLNKAQYYHKLTNGRCMALVCALLLVSSIYLFITNASVRTATTTVPAEIVEIEYLYAYGDTDKTEIEGVTSLIASYEVDGVVMEATLEGGNPLWVVGEKIQIAFDNDDPTKVRYPASYMIATALLIGSVLSGAVAAFNLISVHKIKKWQEQMEKEAEKRKKLEDQENQA